MLSQYLCNQRHTLVELKKEVFAKWHVIHRSIFTKKNKEKKAKRSLREGEPTAKVLSLGGEDNAILIDWHESI